MVLRGLMPTQRPSEGCNTSKIEMPDYAWTWFDHTIAIWFLDCWVCGLQNTFRVPYRMTPPEAGFYESFAVATANRHNKERHDNH